MPQPERFPFLPKRSANAFVDRNELAEAIGRIMSLWNWIEVQVQCLRVTLDGGDLHEAALKLFDTDDSDEMPMAHMTKVMKFVKPAVYEMFNDESKEKLRNAFELWYDAREVRNMIAHGLWQAHRRAPHQIMLLNREAYLRYYTSEQQERARGILTRPNDLSNEVIAERRRDAICDMQDSARLFDGEDFRAIEQAFVDCLRTFEELNSVIDAEIVAGALERCEEARSLGQP